MALRYFEVNVLGSYIVDAWQNHLQTESDPANGKWFRNGPNNGPGLFGGLVDDLASDLVFSQLPDQININRRKDIALSTTLDNRQGLLNDSPATQTLTWTITNSSTATHATSNSVKNGIAEKLTFKGKWGAVEVSSETTISFEYQYSWSDSTSNTTTDTKTFTSSVPLKVPNGKAYKLIVFADTVDLEVPYSARIVLSGTTEANFTHTINGKTNWSANAGALCGWIKQFGSAKDDAMEFDVDPANPARGIASLKGTMRAKQSVNFTIFAIDVTASLDKDPSSSSILKDIYSGKTPRDVVASIPGPSPTK